MSFLGIENRTFLVTGLANRKSVAWFVGKTLETQGACVYYSTRSVERKKELSRYVPEDKLLICDVEQKGAVEQLAEKLKEKVNHLDGFVHSIAFAKSDVLLSWNINVLEGSTGSGMLCQPSFSLCRFESFKYCVVNAV